MYLICSFTFTFHLDFLYSSSLFFLYCLCMACYCYLTCPPPSPPPPLILVSLIWTFPSEPKHTNSLFNHSMSYATEVFSICGAHVAAAFPRSDNGSGLPGSATHDGPSHCTDLFSIQHLQSPHHILPVWEQQQQHASLVNEKRWL